MTSSKSRYLASVGQTTHHDRRYSKKVMELDDPPPPPPNPPNKRVVVSARSVRSASTAKTSAMSSSKNSSNSYPITLSSSAEAAAAEVEASQVDDILQTTISVESASNGSISMNYDDILAEEKSSAESSAFSLPVLSISSAESKARAQRYSGAKSTSSSKASTTSHSRRSSKGGSRQQHEGIAMDGSESLSTMGMSQYESVLSPPPPPPPGAPPSRSVQRSASSSKSSNNSGRSGALSKGQMSAKKTENKEFRAMDFDLDGLQSETSRSFSAEPTTTKSKHSLDSARSKQSSSKQSSNALRRVDELILEENDSVSVETEVLRYGEVTESKSEITSLHSKSTKGVNSVESESISDKPLSVAEKRRRKALTAASASLGSTSIENNEVDHATNVNKKKVANPEDDPPLVLYESEEEDDASEDEGEDRAIQKNTKKKGTFSKVKKFFRNKSPARERKNKPAPNDRKNGRTSPFRKRSPSRTREVKADNHPLRMNSAATAKRENISRRSFTKDESDLSFEVEPPVKQHLSKLESDLSLDAEEAKPNIAPVIKEPPQLLPKSSQLLPKSSHSTKSSHSKKSTHKTPQALSKRVERKQADANSRIFRDPPETTLNDDHSILSDDVSEMTDPTFLSYKMDPPEQSKIGTRSVRSNQSSGNDTPLISNQLSILQEESVQDIESLEFSHNENSTYRSKEPREKQSEDNMDNHEELEDEFFGGMNWEKNKGHNTFYLGTNLSNDQSSSSASKDPFDDPFYTQGGMVSVENEFEASVVSSMSRKNSNGIRIKRHLRQESEIRIDHEMSSNVEAKKEKKIDVKKIKERRNRSSRSISPSKSSRSTSPSKSAHTLSPSKAEYRASPGIKLGQDNVLTKNDDGFFRDKLNKSPNYVKTPSFLAKRQIRDRKEEDIRAKLRRERDAAEREHIAAINTKKRMEDVSKAVEVGRRRDDIISRSLERKSSSSKATRKSLSPVRQSSVSPPKIRQKVLTSSPVRGTNRSLSYSDRLLSKRSDNPDETQRKIRQKPSFLGKQTISKKTTKTPSQSRNKAVSKPFKAPAAFNKPELLPSMSMDIVDPIQRAGIRLLSAAAVPIQTEIRRYLAKKEAEDRYWAVIVIQSYFRRWKAELNMYRVLYCATKIQAAFRGWLVRDTLKHKHYCATQMQRVCRGYLATMKVYEALYNITVVQSIARRRAAIKKSQTLYNSIVQIQSVIRGNFCRQMIQDRNQKALAIQTSWRRFITQLNYQFDTVDIIIVQSIARKRACQKLYAAKLHKKHTKAAIVIQKYWRGYDSTMNYLHCIADILIVQSVVRRRIATRYVRTYRKQRDDEMATRIQSASRGFVARRQYKKYHAAVMIQKNWRGFKQYIDYIFTIADVVMVQKMARGWLAKRRFEAIKVQRAEERIYNAAISIQKVWRGYQAQMDMLFTLVHIIIAQSVIRRRIAIMRFKPMLMERRAAVTIQCAWRKTAARRKRLKIYSARKIQATARGYLTFTLYTQFMAAKKIQSWYRCQATRRGYLYYISARKIQTVWRGYDSRKLADEERWVLDYAATMIQKNWKMYNQNAKYSKFIMERDAATKIQSHWRGFWEYSHFVILRYEIVRIQAAVRGHQTRKQLEMERKNAIIIQAGARVMLARKFCHMERLFSAVMFSATKSLAYKISAKKIQNGFRGYYYGAKEKKAAIVIERFFMWVRSEVEMEIEKRHVKLLKRQKKQSKQGNYEDNLLEDKVLENIWGKTLERAWTPDMGTEKNYESKRAVALKKTRESPTKSRTSYMKFLEKSNEAPSRIANHTSSPLNAKKVAHESVNRHDSVKAADRGLALDFDDESSEVSGLTTPSVTPRYLKQKQKGVDNSLDEELKKAWTVTKRKVLSKRGISLERIGSKINELEADNSSKENSPSPPKTRAAGNRAASRYGSPTRSHRELRAESFRLSLSP